MKKNIIYGMAGLVLAGALTGCALLDQQEAVSRENEDTSIQQMQQDPQAARPRHLPHLEQQGRPPA